MRIMMAALALGAALVPSVAQAQEKVTLNWALWDWGQVAYYKPLIDAYQAKNPNVTINYTDLGSANYNQMVMTQLTGGAQDIDIVAIKDVPNYAQLVSTNVLLDLNKAMSTPVDPVPYNGLIEDLTVDGALYGLPFRSDFWIVYYNKKLFDTAGVGYPTNDMSVEQFDELARKMTSGFGAQKVYGTHIHTWRIAVQYPALLNGQHTLVTDDYSFLAPWYERALSLQEDGVVQPYASLRATNTHYSGPFYNQQIAMMPMGTWFIGTQLAKVKSGESLATEWGIAAVPHPMGVAPGTTAAQVTTLGVSRNSAHQEAAVDFVEFVAGPEGAKIIASTGTLPAVRNEAVIGTIATLPGFPSDENSLKALEPAQTYLELPVDLNAARVDVLLTQAHDAIMTDNVSVEDGIAEMNRDVSEVLQR